MKILNIILKVISLTPLIGLIPLYYIWSLETYYVKATEQRLGLCIVYHDPKIYSFHDFVGICLIITSFLCIPALISTIIGIVLTIKSEKKILIKNLLFYLAPLILFIILLLNILNLSHTDFENPFTALSWFLD